MGRTDEVTVVPMRWVIAWIQDTNWGMVTRSFLLTHAIEWNYAPMPSEWANFAEISTEKLPVMFFDDREVAERMAVLKKMLYPDLRIEVEKWAE